MTSAGFSAEGPLQLQEDSVEKPVPLVERGSRRPLKGGAAVAYFLMSSSAQKALAALQERLRRRSLWAGALVVPGLGIPVLVGFARPGEASETLEKALWLLTFLPLAFLSPLPWQWSGDPSRLNPWKRALPLSLAGGCLAAFLLTAGILALAYPHDAFWSMFLQRLPVSAPALAALSVGLGWPMAGLERLGEQVEAADAQVRALRWMRNRSPFPPELLVRHLRHLAARTEQTPASTVEGILCLAQLYRTWLSMTELPLVPLQAEQTLLDSFFEAERHRSGGAVRCVWEGLSAHSHARVPPFCLFPLSAAALEAGARELRFTVSRQPAGLEIRLSGDPIGHLPQDPAWLETSARLQDAYGGQARLDLESASTLCLFFPGMAA